MTATFCKGIGGIVAVDYEAMLFCLSSAQGYPDIFTLALANFSLYAYLFLQILMREVDIARFGAETVLVLDYQY